MEGGLEGGGQALLSEDGWGWWGRGCAQGKPFFVAKLFINEAEPLIASALDRAVSGGVCCCCCCCCYLLLYWYTVLVYGAAHRQRPRPRRERRRLFDQ